MCVSFYIYVSYVCMYILQCIGNLNLQRQKYLYYLHKEDQFTKLLFLSSFNWKGRGINDDGWGAAERGVVGDE